MITGSREPAGQDRLRRPAAAAGLCRYAPIDQQDHPIASRNPDNVGLSRINAARRQARNARFTTCIRHRFAASS